MNKINLLKLSFLAGSVAAFAVGCASSGYARYDSDANHHDMDKHTTYSSDTTYETRGSSYAVADTRGEARQTVTAISFSPVTDARKVNIFPFYDWNIRETDLYTFAVPEPGAVATRESSRPEFAVDMPPGSVYVESAGGNGEWRAGKVIQHSPNPGLSNF